MNELYQKEPINDRVIACHFSRQAIPKVYSNNAYSPTTNVIDKPCFYRRDSQGKIHPVNYCGKWECKKCGQKRAWNEANLKLAKGFERSGLPPSAWFIFTFKIHHSKRTGNTIEELAMLVFFIKPFLRALIALAKRRGVKLEYFLLPAISPKRHKHGRTLVHAHMAVNWLPDSKRSKRGTCSSEYVTKHAVKNGFTAHFKPIQTTYEAIVGYFYLNMVLSLGYSFPAYLRHAFHSKLFNATPKQLELPLNSSPDTYIPSSLHKQVSPEQPSELLTDTNSDIELLTEQPEPTPYPTANQQATPERLNALNSLFAKAEFSGLALRVTVSDRQTDSQFSPITPLELASLGTAYYELPERGTGNEYQLEFCLSPIVAWWVIQVIPHEFRQRPEWINAAKNWVNSG